ncbi:MAG TPA: sigma-70 family RNA polymerase sigma factor [Hanamia sp.]|nr:sigma-70 family RNA polymerase sigma factor [Hanamia sp.]
MRQHELNDIITACKTNNAIAQEKLYKHFFALMYSICKDYSENQQTVVSLINEGFLKIFMNIQSFDPGKGNFEGWSKRIMTNTAIDHYRSEKNKNKVIELNEDHSVEKDLQQNPKNHVEEEVLYLIKNLPAVTQKVFSLHIFKGYSHKEIAGMLDIAESTSRWHVAEARRNLRQQAHKIF